MSDILYNLVGSKWDSACSWCFPCLAKAGRVASEIGKEWACLIDWETEELGTLESRNAMLYIRDSDRRSNDENPNQITVF